MSMPPTIHTNLQKKCYLTGHTTHSTSYPQDNNQRHHFQTYALPLELEYTSQQLTPIDYLMNQKGVKTLKALQVGEITSQDQV